MAQQKNLRWKVGDVLITRFLEDTADLPCEILFPGSSAAELAEMDWLKPHFINKDGGVTLSIHALLVETPTKTVLVDTCLGNDKQREALGNMLSTDFLERFEEYGVKREAVDAVFCTHLHSDHVGWNCMKVDGEWVPTFPNARYLFAKQEFEYWRDNGQSTDDKALFADSLQPVLDAGLADLVDLDHQICSELQLVPTPGHTPGHCSLSIKSQGQEALITGDATHHPCQWTRPDWAAFVDVDSAASTVTREGLRGDVADKPVLVIGTHYASPTAGHVVQEAGQYRFLADDKQG